MKFTLSWLKEFLDTDATADALAERLTAIGLEIESVTDLSEGLSNFTVAHILSAAPHPDADKLQICKVHTHQDERQIVCGAPNARAGIKVALADIGDIIPSNGLKIKAAKIRGIESSGMLCSASELGLGEDHNGIMELDETAHVGDKLVDVLHLNDTLFDVAITPNRGDCLGVYGIARDLAASGIGALRTLENVAIDAPTGINVSLTTDDCKHFIAYTIEDVSNTDSPEWLQRRLHSIGLRPISTLVDITNYFTLTFGRPLHVYDAEKLSGGITVRSSQKGESIAALNDKSYELPDGLCVIADDHHTLGLGGVIGGEASGCTENTTHVILEAAWFDPISIAHTGQALMIDSDARHRFERTVDPQGTANYAAMAAQMITKLCGGTVTGMTVAGKAPDLTRKIAYTPSMIEAKTGMTVDDAEQRRILGSLGCRISETWEVTTPSWRPDIEGSADLIEEIARIIGYGALPETALPVFKPLVRDASIEDKARNTLLARGLDEAVHFAFTAEQYANCFADASTLLRVANPISSELSVMRPHLFADLLPAIARNHDRGHKAMTLFEIGTVFFGTSPEAQPVRAAGLRTGDTQMHWHHTPKPYDIYDAKADLIALLKALNINTEALMVSRDVPEWYHPGKSARLSLGPKNILGYFGELHPRILRQFDIDKPVVGFECLLDALPRKAKAKKPSAFRPSEFQASRRDFAFIADKSLPSGELKAAIAKTNKDIIKEVTLFDVYEGQHVEDGKKSLAFSVTLQSQDKTLTEQDIVSASDKIVAAAAHKGAVLR